MRSNSGTMGIKEMDNKRDPYGWFEWYCNFFKVGE